MPPILVDDDKAQTEAEVQDLIKPLDAIDHDLVVGKAEPTRVLPTDSALNNPNFTVEELLELPRDYMPQESYFNWLYVIIPLLVLLMLILLFFLYRNYRRYSPHHNRTFEVNKPSGPDTASLVNMNGKEVDNNYNRKELTCIPEEDALSGRENDSFYIGTKRPKMSPGASEHGSSEYGPPPSKTWVSAEAFV